LLDLLEIEFLVPQPHTFQVENHRIDPRLRWTYRGSLPWQKLLPHVDRSTGPLWVNAGSSRNGHNDMVPEDVAPTLQNSLRLVQPDELRVTVTMEGSKSGEAKRRIRGEFEVADSWYIFSITDCAFEQSLAKQDAGFSKVLRRPLLCLSVSEVVPQMHACYKLIAGVVATEK